MLKNINITFTLAIAFFLGFVYFALLSDSGYIQRQKLEKKLSLLNLEIERLENKNNHLRSKKIKLKNDKIALEMEARKYYLLRKNARIIKFKEPANDSKESDELLLASRFMDLQLTKSQLSVYRLPEIATLRVFYIIVSIFIFIGVLFKFNSSSSENI